MSPLTGDPQACILMSEQEKNQSKIMTVNSCTGAVGGRINSAPKLSLYVCISVYVRIYVCIHICTHVCVCVFMYECKIHLK